MKMDRLREDECEICGKPGSRFVMLGKMFTCEEFMTLEAEALERYQRHLDELQRDNARHGYGVCL